MEHLEDAERSGHFARPRVSKGWLQPSTVQSAPLWGFWSLMRQCEPGSWVLALCPALAFRIPHGASHTKLNTLPVSIKSDTGFNPAVIEHEVPGHDTDTAQTTLREHSV